MVFKCYKYTPTNLFRITRVPESPSSGSPSRKPGDWGLIYDLQAFEGPLTGTTWNISLAELKDGSKWKFVGS
jgi:hypothetical protein